MKSSIILTSGLQGSTIMRLMVLLCCLIATPICQARLSVFTCEPEWASLVNEIAANQVDTFSATTAFQDPHYIQARPSLIARLRKADLLVCTGADLEVGWLPLLLRRAANSKLRTGQPGYFMASDHVRKLEVPARIDRSDGDTHPQGNPHVHLDPRNITRISKALSAVLVGLDPENRDAYTEALETFTTRWNAASTGWREKARPLKGQAVITHHRSFSYFLNWLGLVLIDTIEPMPGISPSSSHLSQLLQKINTEKPAFVLRTPFTDPKPSEWLADKTGITTAELPYTVGDSHSATNLFELFENSIDMLIETHEY
jgi:zinc/manganese transport system substrate-binding protein